MTTYSGYSTYDGSVKNVLAVQQQQLHQAEGSEPIISLDDATPCSTSSATPAYLSSRITYPARATTTRDYVEYPSQVHEPLGAGRADLDGYMKHVETASRCPGAGRQDRGGAANQPGL